MKKKERSKNNGFLLSLCPLSPTTVRRREEERDIERENGKKTKIEIAMREGMKA